MWLCAAIALAPLVLIPASGQDGPPIGSQTPAVATPKSPAATTKNSGATAKTAPAVKAKSEKVQTSPKAETIAKAGDPPEKAGDPPKAEAPKLTGVAAQCANLLDMAKTLKTDVEKTTQDVLSVAVVRDADKIERTAHKMRDDRKH